MKCDTESERDEIIKRLEQAGADKIDVLAESIIFLDHMRAEVVPRFAYRWDDG